MSEERKAKAAARKAARKQKNASVETQPLETPAAELNISTDIPKPAELGSAVPVYGGSLEAATVTANNDNKPSTIVSKATVQNPVGLAGTENHPALGGNTKSILPMNETPAATPEEQPQTFESMLAGLKKTVQQEKTDAAKMQKYYALTDALKSLGKMGGTAIGGSLGGGALDSASVVKEYQPSRGYLDAFEKAKQANDRLRNLEEKEFQLAYNKQQKDEDRAYKAEQDQIAREWQEKRDNLQREWQEKRDALQREWQDASADKKAEIEERILNLKLAHEKEMKELSKEMVKMQMAGKDEKNVSSPVIFDDGRVAYLDREDLMALRNRYINRKVGDVMIGEENFYEFIAQNPQAVENYLKTIGKKSKFLSLEPEVEITKQEVAEQQPVEQQQKEEKPKNSFWQKLGSAVQKAGDAQVPSYTPELLGRNSESNATPTVDPQYYINKYGVQK